MTIAPPCPVASFQFQGKATAFFVEFFQGHFILHRRPCLGTPNFMSCQPIYQGWMGGIGQKKDVFLDK